MKKRKLVLAYSGGLDTSCCLKWLQDKGFDVICFAADLGSEFSATELRGKAKKGNAAAIYIKDLRREFAEDYILPALRSGALYQNKYLLGTALGRPLIAKHLVETAGKENARYVAHGCSAKGNDQIRLEIAVKSLDPDLEIIAPLRTWELNSREDEIEFAKQHNIPVSSTKEKIYSIDKNIWGASIEAGILEDLKNRPPEDAYILTKSPQEAPDRKERIKIELRNAEPVKLNGKRMGLVNLIQELNRIGGRHAIGRTDLVEERTIGIKSRELYEAPAAWILFKAFREIEELVFSKEMLDFKEIVAARYSDLVYQGFWFSGLKESLDAFSRSHAERITGEICFELYKGNITTLSRRSEYSLYKKSLATYGKRDAFCREWADGFINIFGMSLKKGN